MKTKNPKRQAAGRKSKAKGNRTENELCKLLRDATDVEWQRTPHSGGSELASGWRLAGDVATPDTKWKFCVEHKADERWHLEQVFEPTSVIWSYFWRQTVSETPAGMCPMLVFKRNYTQRLVMCRGADLPPGASDLPGVLFLHTDADGWLVLMLFENLLEYIKGHKEQFVNKE